MFVFYNHVMKISPLTTFNFSKPKNQKKYTFLNISFAKKNDPLQNALVDSKTKETNKAVDNLIKRVLKLEKLLVAQVLSRKSSFK